MLRAKIVVNRFGVSAHLGPSEVALSQWLVFGTQHGLVATDANAPEALRRLRGPFSGHQLGVSNDIREK